MVRISGIGRGFRHDSGLVVAETWMEVHALTDDQRAALRDHHGRYLRIHPDDVTNLPKELGLELVHPKKPLADVKRSASKTDKTSKPAS